MIINVYRSSCKVTVILVIFWWILNFLNRSSENNQIPNFMRIRPVGTEFIRAKERTDAYDEANIRFSQIYERA